MRTALLAIVATLPFASTARAGEVLFDHEMHVVTNNRGCEYCHEASGPDASKINLLVCADCHQTAIPFKPRPVPKMGVRFQHAPHMEGVTCVSCHEAVVQPNRAPQPVMARTACIRCHEERGLRRAERDCTACHGQDQRLVKPADHSGAWLRRHGGDPQDRVFETHGKDCSYCHGNDSCVSCHRQRRPASHNGLWRVRLHGVSAQWDRAGCKACHETGVCIRCHETTRPLNHNGSWTALHGLAAGAASNETCRACHASAFCLKCHRVPK